MHYDAKKVIIDDEIVDCIPAFLNMKDVDTKDIFRFIDTLEILIADDNTFDFEFFNEAKLHLVEFKNDRVKTFEEYRKFNYYIDKLKWLKIKNIKNIYEDKDRELANEIQAKYPNLKYPLLNLSVNQMSYREALLKMQQEIMMDMLSEVRE